MQDNNQNKEEKRRSLAEIVAADGPMEERRAMGIARALCNRLMDQDSVTEADLAALHPNTILLSAEETISFSGEAVSEAAREPYLPPEYVKGSGSKEGVVIYGLGMLLLFLVTGRTKKSAMDAGVRNSTLKTVINRCTALDTRRRYQSLTEVWTALNRELVFPRRRMRRLGLTLLACLAVIASLYVFVRGKTLSQAEGSAAGYQSGYKDGYEAGVSDAPGIGVEDVVFPEGYGNLFGNLNAKDGAFALMGDGNIYYANKGRLYRMDPYTGRTAFLAQHRELTSLNYWKGYLFYLTEDALVRLDTGSGQEETVSDRLRGRFCICGGTLFLDDESSTGFLYGINAASLETRQLNSDRAHDHLAVTAEKLFYTDPSKGGSLFGSDHDGGNVSRLLSKPCRDIDLCGERIYCLTAGKRTDGEPDTLVSMDATGGEAQILSNQPVSRFAAEENGIYYISASTGFLEWMTPDGKTRYTISASKVSDFNLAGRWIFYRLTGDDALYRMRIDGSDSEMLP